MINKGRSSRCRRFVKQILVAMGVIWLLMMMMIGVIGSNEVKKMHINGRKAAAGNMAEEARSIDKHKAAANVIPKMDINFISKRRVPNGPDPIHNRKAGNSHQPPGQA